MRFDEQHMVLINSLTTEEASAFIKFLKSEILRHEMDIKNARNLIYKICMKYKLGDLLDDY